MGWLVSGCLGSGLFVVCCYRYFGSRLIVLFIVVLVVVCFIVGFRVWVLMLGLLVVV